MGNNKKISELLKVTSTNPTDELVMRRGSGNVSIEAQNLSSDTGSLVATSSISGTTITFTKGDGVTYTNEIVSASYASLALTASYSFSSSVEVTKEVSSSFADTASHAITASYALTSAPAASTEGSLTNDATIDGFVFNGATDVTMSISTYSASAATALTSISASLTSADQVISSSVAALSSSASDSRNTLGGDLDAVSASFSTSQTALSSSVSTDITALSSSASTARDVVASQVTGSLTALSASLTTTDQAISSSVAALSSSASDARNTLGGDLDAVSASFSTSQTALSSSVSTDLTALSSSASTARDVAASQVTGSLIALSSSLTVTDQTISSSVATLSGSASTARNVLASQVTGSFTALSASLTTTDQAISSSVATLSGSASTARNVLASQVTGSFTALSSSLTVTDQAISSSVATLSGSASDARNAITNVLSSSYALTASYAISSSVEIKQEISSSYADTASYAVSASYAVTASYAISSSVEITKEVSSSYADTASYALDAVSASYSIFAESATQATRSTRLNIGTIQNNPNFRALGVVTTSGTNGTITIDDDIQWKGNPNVLKINGEILASNVSASSFTGSLLSTNGVLSGSSQIDITTIEGYTAFSSSLQTTDQSISSSVAALSASASTRRDVMFSQLAFMNTSLSGSNSVSRNTLARQVSGSFTSVSSSLTTTDQTISSSVATLSGSASTARDLLAIQVTGSFTALSSSASTARDVAASQVTGSFTALSASASTARDVAASQVTGSFTELSASLTTTDQTISASVATLSGSASTARDEFLFESIEYKTSNKRSYSQLYLGNNNGGQFQTGEYQKVVTVIPSGNSQNYEILGRVTVQNGPHYHTLYFNSSLRSNTLPDLDFKVAFNEEYSTDRYIKPLLWVKETGTSGFIFAFEVLANIFGNVTVDIDVIPRFDNFHTNVTVNTNQSSDQTTIDSGYTSNDFDRTYEIDGIITKFTSLDTTGLSVVSSSYALTASYAESSTTLSGSASTARDVLASQVTGSFTALSASLTTTDQAISSSVAALSSSASDARDAITNVLSSSYALTASYAISSSVEIRQEVSSSYAETATSASYAITASYAISSSVEITKEVSSSYADTASYSIFAESATDSNLTQRIRIPNQNVGAYRNIPIAASTGTSGNLVHDTTLRWHGVNNTLSITGSLISDQITGSLLSTNGVLSGSSQIDITTIEGYTAFSSSLTVTDQAISSSVATLSGSASTARNVLSVELTDLLGVDIAALSSSASTARDILASQVTGSFTALSSSASTARDVLASQVTGSFTALSGSASTARDVLASQVTGSFTALSGSASTSRNVLASQVTGSFTALSASLTTTDQVNSASAASGIATNAAGIITVFTNLNSQLTAKANTNYVNSEVLILETADTTNSASLTVTDQAISSSVATLSGSASDARQLIADGIETGLSASASTARNVLASQVSGSFTSVSSSLTTTDQVNSASAASGIATNAAGIITIFTNLNSQLTAKANTNYVNSEVLILETADTTNSASLTVTDQAISASSAALSGSASTARNAIVSDYSPKVSGSFAQYISRLDQTGAAATIHFLTHNTNTIEQNISIAANDYEITVANAGKYELKNTTQWQRTSGVADNVSLWIQVNGSNVGFSTNSLNLTDNFIVPIYAQWILDLDAGDVVRIVWSSTAGSAKIIKRAAFSNPTRPMTPSVNTHLIKIGD